MDGDGTAKTFSPIGDHKQKNIFSLEGEKKNAMTKCKPLNICLLKTFPVLSHTTPLSRKIDLFNLKIAEI